MWTALTGPPHRHLKGHCGLHCLADGRAHAHACHLIGLTAVVRWPTCGPEADAVRSARPSRVRDTDEIYGWVGALGRGFRPRGPKGAHADEMCRHVGVELMMQLVKDSPRRVSTGGISTHCFPLACPVVHRGKPSCQYPLAIMAAIIPPAPTPTLQSSVPRPAVAPASSSNRSMPSAGTRIVSHRIRRQQQQQHPLRRRVPASHALAHAPHSWFPRPDADALRACVRACAPGTGLS